MILCQLRPIPSYSSICLLLQTATQLRKEAPLSVSVKQIDLPSHGVGELYNRVITWPLRARTVHAWIDA